MEELPKVFLLDLQSSESKPWNAPGSNLSDYFNYNFSEESWTKYVQYVRSNYQTKLNKDQLRETYTEGGEKAEEATSRQHQNINFYLPHEIGGLAAPTETAFKKHYKSVNLFPENDHPPYLCGRNNGYFIKLSKTGLL